MRTLREAAALLSRIVTTSDLAVILPALGFSPDPAPLDRESLRALGIGPLVRGAAISRGSGSLRALVVDARDVLPLRETTRKISERLAHTSPHILWLLLALHRQSRCLALTAWSSDGRRTRASALVVELDHVVDSDAETLCALAAVRDSVDVLVHSRWVDLLGRDALTQRFYRTLENVVRSMGAGVYGASHAADRDELALLQVSRLLFLSFLEAKGWLNGDRGFLAETFNACMMRGGNYQRRVLLPLLFGTLNTPFPNRSSAAREFGRLPFLNGGLFARAHSERRNNGASIPDEFFGELFGNLLSRYRFTAREDSSSYSEAAIDPEMLGKAFESLMAPRARHSSGAFYTPQRMVEHVTHSALLDALCRRTRLPPEHVDAALRGQDVGPDAAAALRRCGGSLRVLDTACGSGAFLVHSLERLSALLLNAGDNRHVAAVRRNLLSSSIFGVDINPMAVWLCELRLWLSIVIDSDESDPRAVPPLPNLDHNIRIGDSLAGGAFDGASLSPPRGPLHGTLRARYMRATGPRKQALARTLDALERKHALAAIVQKLAVVSTKRRDLVASERSRDLFGDRAHTRHVRPAAQGLLREASRRLRAAARELERGGALPFSFVSHFPDAGSAGGFDIVIGNPPWVRLERIPHEARMAMRRDFDVFRLAGWHPAVNQNRPAPTFSAQVDLAALFVERSLSLAQEGGTVAMIIPAKLWRSLAGSGLRQLLARDSTVVEVEDWSESLPAFDAVVYPSVLLARRRGTMPRSDAPVLAAIHSRDRALRWSVGAGALPLDDSPGAPWLLVPAEVRASFDLLARMGTAIGASHLCAPRLGVKCGRNDAFIVNIQGHEDHFARVRSGLRVGCVESKLLRPLVRGESVQRWSTAAASEHIVWTHGPDTRPLPTLPPLARRWLSQWRLDLSRRADLSDGGSWWSLFRTETARNDCWRVIWPDIGRSPRAAILPPGSSAVPLNSCYVSLLPDEDDALALAALLNSPHAAAWLNILAEQARGGYRRYFAWTVSLFPIPLQWQTAREVLAPVARRALEGHAPRDSELLDAVLRVYGVSHDSIAPLLTWNSR